MPLKIISIIECILYFINCTLEPTYTYTIIIGKVVIRYKVIANIGMFYQSFTSYVFIMKLIK